MTPQGVVMVVENQEMMGLMAIEQEKVEPKLQVVPLELLELLERLVQHYKVEKELILVLVLLVEVVVILVVVVVEQLLVLELEEVDLVISIQH